MDEIVGRSHEDHAVETFPPSIAVLGLKDQCRLDDDNGRGILRKDGCGQLRLPRDRRRMHDRVQLFDTAIGERKPGQLRAVQAPI